MQSQPVSKPSRDPGLSCHQCKSRRDKTTLLPCTTYLHKGPRGCKKKYCFHCLMRFYGLNCWSLNKAELSELQNEWLCYGCQGTCLCASCKRRRDVQESIEHAIEYAAEVRVTRGMLAQEETYSQPDDQYRPNDTQENSGLLSHDDDDIEPPCHINFHPQSTVQILHSQSILSDGSDFEFKDENKNNITVQNNVNNLPNIVTLSQNSTNSHISTHNNPNYTLHTQPSARKNRLPYATKRGSNRRYDSSDEEYGSTRTRRRKEKRAVDLEPQRKMKNHDDVSSSEEWYGNACLPNNKRTRIRQPNATTPSTQTIPSRNNKRQICTVNISSQYNQLGYGIDMFEKFGQPCVLNLKPMSEIEERDQKIKLLSISTQQPQLDSDTHYKPHFYNTAESILIQLTKDNHCTEIDTLDMLTILEPPPHPFFPVLNPDLRLSKFTKSTNNAGITASATSFHKKVIHMQSPSPLPHVIVAPHDSLYNSNPSFAPENAPLFPKPYQMQCDHEKKLINDLYTTLGYFYANEAIDAIVKLPIPNAMADVLKTLEQRRENALNVTKAQTKQEKSEIMTKTQESLFTIVVERNINEKKSHIAANILPGLKNDPQKNENEIDYSKETIQSLLCMIQEQLASLREDGQNEI